MNRRAVLGLLAVVSSTGPPAHKPRHRSSLFWALPRRRPTVPRWKRFRQGLTEQGLVEGRSVRIEARHASGDLALASRYIDVLVQRGTAVFVVPGPAAAPGEVQRTTAIPVVIEVGAHAGGRGSLWGLARPGGSVTGFSTIGEELSGKRIELLRRALPHDHAGHHRNVAIRYFATGDDRVGGARPGLATLRLGLTVKSDAELVQRLRP